MTLTDLIAEAWDAERARYRWVDYPGPPALITLHPPRVVLAGTQDDCERHLSALCAKAVLRALREARYGVGQATGRGIVRGRDLIPAELE